MTDASDKTGMPTWLKWTLGIIFLPIGIVWGVVVMWRRGMFNLAVRIGLTLAAPVALFILAAVGVGIVQGAGSVGSTPPATASTPETPKEEPAAAPAPKKKPQPSFVDGEVTEATTKVALGSVLANGAKLTKVEVADNLGTEAEGDKIVHVSYEPGGGAGLAPRPMLMDLAKTSSGVFKVLFANPTVSAADVTAVVVMTGTDGADDKTAGARIYWDRTTADAVDWVKYESDVTGGYYWDAFTGAPDFYVHPGVLASLSAEDRAKLQR